jgi:hypothetical protein
MSAKDAPGEVNENPNFDSPNISSAADEEQQAIDAAAEERKKAETVDIDGIPIEEKELQFKAEDIKKKGKTEYFVNVEGAEERKKEAAKKAKEEAEAAARKAKEEKAAADKAAAEQAAAEAKAKTEEEKHQKAEDTRVIGELKQKAKARKKQNREIAQKEKQEKFKQYIRDDLQESARRANKVKKFFFGGWHKIITILVILIIIAIPTFFIVNTNIEKKTKNEERDQQQKLADLKNEVMMLSDEDVKGNKDKIISNVKEIDDIEQDVRSAIDVMNWARLYGDKELENEYYQKCVDRGGCQEDAGGKG